MNLTDLSIQIYEANKAKGFWDTQRNEGELFALILSEAAEALEGHRKGKYADLLKFDAAFAAAKSKMVNHDPFTKCFVDYIKDSPADELADVIIRVLDFIGSKGWEIEQYPPNSIWVIEQYPPIPILTDNFGEMIIELSAFIVDAYNNIKYDSVFTMNSIERIIIYCYSIAVKMNIELDRHIELKLKFNATRPIRHGKNY